MERRIENSIDRALENIAPQLYIFSVGAGIALAIAGLVLYLAGKNSKEKSGKINAGLILMGMGILAIASGAVQML